MHDFSAQKKIKLDLVIPAFNEASVIKDTAKTVHDVLSAIPDMECSIIVADNGSTDNTKQRALEAGLPNVRVLEIKGKGKGLAVRTAVNNSSADIFGFIDADLSADPSLIPDFAGKIRSREADIVIGSRLLGNKEINRGFWRTLSSRLFNFLRKIILGIDVTDSQCGLKIMNRRGMEILGLCAENTWFFDLEFLFLSQKRGLRVLEIPVVWEEFRYAGRKSKLNVFRDGVSAIIAMFRIRVRMRNKI